MSYNQFIHGLKLAQIELDRKILADLAVNDPAGFASLATQAKGAIGGAALVSAAASVLQIVILSGARPIREASRFAQSKDPS